MNNQIRIGLFSMDSYLTVSMVNILSEFSSINASNNISSRCLPGYVFDSEFSMVFIDRRSLNVNVFCEFIRSEVNLLWPSLTLLSFSQDDGILCRKIFNNRINISLSVNVIISNITEIINLWVDSNKAKNKNHPDPSSLLISLTGIEKKVIELMLAGVSINSIASKFMRSSKTIHSHKYNALRKLGFRTLNEYVAFNNSMNI